MNLREIGAFQRLREIMADAPWSNHDLLVGISLFFVGVIFAINSESFQQLRALAYLRNTHIPWAIVFIVIGGLNILNTVWCVEPPFWVRLLSRMAGAFCFLTLAFSNMMFAILIPSTIVYLLIALWSTWGILRTKASGR